MNVTMTIVGGLTLVGMLGCSGGVDEGVEHSVVQKSGPQRVRLIQHEVRDLKAKPAEVDWSVPISGRLSRDQPCIGELGPFASYSLNGRAGDLVRFRVRSDAFVPVVALVEESAHGAILLDFAAAKTNNEPAELAFELVRTGLHRVVAASASRSGAGEFTLERVESPPEPRHPSGTADQVFALVVSIQDYPLDQIDLEGPHRDSDSFVQFLAGDCSVPKQNIQVLRDEFATRQGLTRAWLEHLGRAGPDGVAIFYYSGHGIQLSEGEAADEEDGRDEALILANGTVLIDDELGHLADGLHAGQVTIVLDCCYSGTGTRSGDGIAKRASPDKLGFVLTLPEVRFGASSSKGISGRSGRHLLLAAAAEDQIAFVSRSSPSPEAVPPLSVFTYFLLESIRGRTAQATLVDVMNATERLTRDFVAYRMGSLQTPKMMGGSEGASALSAFTLSPPGDKSP